MLYLRVGLITAAVAGRAPEDLDAQVVDPGPSFGAAGRNGKDPQQ